MRSLFSLFLDLVFLYLLGRAAWYFLQAFQIIARVRRMQAPMIQYAVTFLGAKKQYSPGELLIALEMQADRLATRALSLSGWVAGAGRMSDHMLLERSGHILAAQFVANKSPLKFFTRSYRRDSRRLAATARRIAASKDCPKVWRENLRDWAASVDVWAISAHSQIKPLIKEDRDSALREAA